ncbi:MAG: hypothetical protein COS82_01315 [Zetaproteobacteria bacterium CG06_land_8_20_14_3_00_59_53]|nr:MAG: hypothetical protein COX56_02365 [Zetaproteobacteria bacterium CG23_combo_of_CG06-09_8_20_14_all_59_86]PIQ66124.1 MAG: hypothetical protein COV97_00585 [Zetaproteobacteria bacterium CG11_big_fil_rev_8_21_14_0_20_59_439]PIU71559.1 MAG: hypothetical protein COS82_01315 [Zetaproteobacteria bacterium CG06_land_8_20_14_3_00_59_53]PIU97819.1 MAG: hypothetical protein COS62_02295 [Zetaproteobacteria bacterium CG03_land_8_20_14_0_80_59_51]PIY45907.1 MAG: hypothetical protein COZ02_07980 [Zetapr
MSANPLDVTESQSVSGLDGFFEAILNGDFQWRMPPGNALAGQVNAVMQHLDALMLQELKGKVEMAVSGFESTIVMARLDASASEVRERTESMAAATEEMSATVKLMAERAGDVRELSVSATESVATGHSSMDETVQVMAETSSQMMAAIQQMDQLKTISGEIGQLLGTIKKISDQTNLLALNATIEAARAGEAGKGFAVVAGEVKELSRQTRQVTDNISEKSQAIEHTVSTAVNSIETISDTVQKAAAALAVSGEAMNDIAGNMRMVDERVRDITHAAEDQSLASAEIAGGVATTAQEADALKHLAQDSLDMTDQLGNRVREDLASFATLKISDAVIQLAKSDHMLWKKRLIDMILDRGEIRVEEVTDHHQCRLGKWYDTAGREHYGHMPGFTQLMDPHADVHRLAKSAVARFNKGDKAGAVADVEAIGPLSDKVVELLTTLEKQ